MNHELNAQIQVWRQKAAAGILTQEEMKQAIAALRQGRTVAAATSAKSRTAKAAKASVNSEDLLNQLEGL